MMGSKFAYVGVEGCATESSWWWNLTSREILRQPMLVTFLVARSILLLWQIECLSEMGRGAKDFIVHLLLRLLLSSLSRRITLLRLLSLRRTLSSFILFYGVLSRNRVIAYRAGPSVNQPASSRIRSLLYLVFSRYCISQALIIALLYYT